MYVGKYAFFRDSGGSKTKKVNVFSQEVCDVICAGVWASIQQASASNAKM
jgi:hypothetical protein